MGPCLQSMSEYNYNNKNTSEEFIDIHKLRVYTGWLIKSKRLQSRQ